MRPSSRELLEGIAAALDRQVAPAVEDKWAASVLRSAVQLLGHLAVRVEDEARILEEDNVDAHQVLAAIAARIRDDAPDAAALAAPVSDALQAGGAPSVDSISLSARNDAYQLAIECLIRHRDELRELTGDERAHEGLRGYLKRRLVREHHLYFPSFTGAPF